jgi:hypothetical protein
VNVASNYLIHKIHACFFGANFLSRTVCCFQVYVETKLISSPQLYYHYNVVLQLKALYDEILRPELTEDENPPPSVESGPSKKEKGKQAPAGGGGGGGKKEKEKERGESGRDNKKGKTVKTEPSEKVESKNKTRYI